MTQVPTPTKETVEPEIEQTDAAVASMVNTTGLPDPPPVALGV